MKVQPSAECGDGECAIDKPDQPWMSVLHSDLPSDRVGAEDESCSWKQVVERKPRGRRQSSSERTSRTSCLSSKENDGSDLEQTEAHGKQHQHEKQKSGQSGIREGGKAQGELLPGTGV